MTRHALTSEVRAWIRAFVAEHSRMPGEKVMHAAGWTLYHARQILRLALADPEWRAVPRKHHKNADKAVTEDPRKVEIEEVTHHDDRTDVSARGQGLVMTPESLVVEAGLDLTRWRLDSAKVKTSAVTIKDADDQPRVIRMWHVHAGLTPVIHVEDVRVQTLAPVAVRPVLGSAARCTLVVPDSQHGYRWTPRTPGQPQRLVPTHDPAAVACCIAVARELQPDRIVILGDMLDLPEWSLRWTVAPDRRETTRPALAALGWFLDQLRMACPLAEIVYMAGNHEDRIERYLVAHPLAGLEDRLAIPQLLDLERRGIQYVGPYGAEYRADGVRYIHGDRVRQRGGATAAAVLGDTAESTFFGHIHRLELAHRTWHGPDGPRVVFVGSPGCLTSLVGETPGSTRPDWQHGLGFVWHDAGESWAEIRAIVRGRAMLDGRMVYGEEVRLSDVIGWPVMDGYAA